jgi:4-hydroxy-tetrahydrodipicolinate reductase
MNKVCIIGINGKMGSMVAQLIDKYPELELELAGGIDISEGEFLGKPVKTKIEYFIDMVNVFVDFSNKDAILNLLPAITKSRTPIVIGTTGLSAEQKNEIFSYSKEIPILLSPNMSIGINLLFEIVKKVTNVLKDYDVEIIEMHHHRKKDSPSGTAKRIAQVIATERGTNYNDSVVLRGEGITGPRKKNQIGISVVRGGEIVGEHSILFLSDNERFEITHKALSRMVFAQGTIKAIKFIITKPPGMYSMKDVLKTLNPKS